MQNVYIEPFIVYSVRPTNASTLFSKLMEENPWQAINCPSAAQKVAWFLYTPRELFYAYQSLIVFHIPREVNGVRRLPVPFF